MDPSGQFRVKATFHSKPGEHFVLELFARPKIALVVARLQMQGCVQGGGGGGNVPGKTSGSERPWPSPGRMVISFQPPSLRA